MPTTFRPTLDSAFRSSLRATDADAVGALIRATGFFYDHEEAIAIELVEEALAQKGLAHPGGDYHFLFADGPEFLLGYSCFGPVPLTVGSWDLYWIAVHPQTQGQGLGRKLLRASEDAAAAAGASQFFVDTSGRALYEPTRAFYERCGYQRAATLEDFYGPGDPKVIYQRRFPTTHPTR